MYIPIPDVPEIKKIEKVPRDIWGENFVKIQENHDKFGKLVSIIGAYAS